MSDTFSRRGALGLLGAAGAAPLLGAAPAAGTFHTAPAGRAPFTFTSFGDQATPEVTWTAQAGVFPGLDANSTPASKDVVTGVETVAPLFHLLNGDLCYANLDVDRVR